MNEHWLHTFELEKGCFAFDACLHRRACNVILYQIPNSARRFILPVAATTSSEVNGQVQRVQSTSVSLSMGNFKGELDDLFNEVKALTHLGKEKEATCLLQANFEAVKEQLDMGARGIEEAATLDVIALGYMTLGDLSMVLSLLDELDEIVKELKDDEPLLDSILMHMGSMCTKLENFESATYCYSRAIEIMESRYGESSSSLVPPLLELGKVLSCTGSAAKAIETYHRVTKMLESAKGEECEELTVPLIASGNLLIKERKGADAESIFDRVLNIYIKLHGEQDGRCGLAMSSLAHAKCAKGDVDEAIVLYKKALKIVEDSKFLAVDDNTMEKMRIDLAELLHVVGSSIGFRVDESRALLEQCLLISNKYRGKEHPSSVTHLINLASSYSRSKIFPEAERLLSLGLRIMMKTVPPDDPSLTFPMLHLAIILYNMNRDQEAEELALDVIRIRESAFGNESLPVGEALDCLVSIQTRLQKDDHQLLGQLKRLLKIQEKAFGHESEEVIGTLKKIVYYLGKIGKKDEIFPLRRRLTMLRKKSRDMVQY
ncbi:hypothetical protein LIER_37467 [Lithospermum erythrorhizon]|uniref:Nephrocystin-3 n=1 Tax=Lithospermum erythrorhizon TaxID=34254 RepID=A0AAV3PQ51_LITER